MNARYEKGGQDSIIYYFSDILDIANQCAYSGGSAVIRSRVLISLFEDILEYNDEEICAQEGYRLLQQKKNSVSTASFTIIRNPANDKIEIRIKGNLENTGDLFITNIFGECVLYQRIDCKRRSHFINILNLSSGIYLAKLNSNIGDQLIQKLVVVR